MIFALAAAVKNTKSVVDERNKEILEEDFNRYKVEGEEFVYYDRVYSCYFS
jgi:hypothetical protein